MVDAWDTVDLGRMAYAAALELQREVNFSVSRGEAGPTVLLVEHEPVITVSQRRGAGEHLLASEARLAELGIEVRDTDRGGDITYHGPGQLVAYPIVRLGDFGLNLGRYMRALERAVIAAVGGFGVVGVTEAGATGVWVGAEAADAVGGRETAKLCAMGVRVRKNTTMHGLALNVTTDLSHFETIDPCGLGGRAVTSLERLLGDACPSMAEVKSALVAALRDELTGAGRGVEPASVAWPGGGR